MFGAPMVGMATVPHGAVEGFKLKEACFESFSSGRKGNTAT